MKPTTNVGLAVRHVGKSGSRVEAWEGTFAHVLLRFAAYVGKEYMATRFDLCMARTEIEARRGLTVGGRGTSQVEEELSLESLERLMNQTPPEGAIPGNDHPDASTSLHESNQ